MPFSKLELLSFTDDISEYLRTSKAPIIITGASGWLGQAVLEMCHSALENSFARKVSAYTSVPKTIVLRSGVKITAEAFDDLRHKKIKNAIIFHCAYLTREKSAVYGEKLYIERNREITGTLHSFIMRNNSCGLFIPSSGAVYGPNREINNNINTNSYGVLKFEDEILFTELSKHLSFPISIMRIFNLSGPFMNKVDSYALASIIHDAACKDVIHLNSPAPVTRSYAYIEDVLNFGLHILYRKESMAAVDTCGEVEIELSHLARKVSLIMGKPNMVIKRPPLIVGNQNHYVGSQEPYLSLSKKFGIELKNLDKQIKSTVDYLAGVKVC